MNSRSPVRGFSLIEALVALAVMAFGMLGVVGIQATLRQYADISKQRSEAVRIAQEANEGWRAFVKLDADAAVVDYAEITSVGWAAVSGAIASATNTNYEIQRIATRLPDSAQFPQSGLWLTTSVRWNDRTGEAQQIDLFTHLAGVSPDLAGTLLVPPAGTSASATRRPLGRHVAIPRGAIDDGHGSSQFAPPGMPTTVWTFDNATGLITRICSPTCTGSSFVAALISGYVRFADPSSAPPTVYTQPTSADSETPSSSSLSFGTIGVVVDVTAPVSASVPCASAMSATSVNYFCAIDISSTGKWSGRASISGPVFAADAADADLSKARACRYTPVDVHAAANVDHPLDYVDVAQALTNQNFLLIRAGDGTTPFMCTDDDASTPFVNGNTFVHQPAT